MKAVKWSHKHTHTQTLWHTHTHINAVALACGNINEAKSNAKKHQKQQKAASCWPGQRIVAEAHTHTQAGTQIHTYTWRAIQMRCEINRIVAISDASFDFGAVSMVACRVALSWSHGHGSSRCVSVYVSVCVCVRFFSLVLPRIALWVNWVWNQNSISGTALFEGGDVDVGVSYQKSV